MNAFHKEKLLPAVINNKRDEQHKIIMPEFTGTINVNPLRMKPKNPLDLKLDLFEQPKNEKNKKVFASYKQEQHYRLNREHKLKVNDEISNYIKNKKNQNQNIAKKFNMKNEREQIKDAAKQLDEINHILEHNKKNPSKKADPVRNNFDGISFFVEKTNKRLPSESNLKHMCTKGLRNKMTHYNITNSDKKIRHNENNNGDNFSTADVLNPTELLNKISNQRNKKNIKNAIDALNIRLTNSKEKIMLEYEASLKKSKEKMAEFETFQRKRGLKYKSIKDVKLNEEKLKEFENEIKVKRKQVEDPKEMKLLYKNEIFQPEDNISEIQIDKHILPDKYKKFLMPNKELIDLKIKLDLGNENRETETSYSKKSPKKDLISRELEISLQKVKNLDLKPPKDINLSPKQRKKSPKSPITVLRAPETISKGVGQDIETNDLEKSILKSDYLTKEFHMGGDNIGNKKEENIVNWADKFKVTQPKKWSNNFEYFLA